MSGLELSIPLSVLTTIQAIGLNVSVVLDLKKDNHKRLSNVSIIGILLLLFNCLRTVREANLNEFDSVSFTVMCGLVSTLFLQEHIKSRIRLLYIALFNALLYTVIWFVIKSLIPIDSYSQLLLMAVFLNVYFIVSGMVTFFRLSETNPGKKIAFKLFLRMITIVGAFGTIIITRIELYGVLTLNFFFLIFLFQEYWSIFSVIEENGKVSCTEFPDDENTDSKGLPSVTLPKDVRSENIEDYDLTARQLEIAQLLLTRLNRDQIAEKLGVKVATIGSHCHEIFKKTKTISRPDFIVKFSKNEPYSTKKQPDKDGLEL